MVKKNYKFPVLKHRVVTEEQAQRVYSALRLYIHRCIHYTAAQGIIRVCEYSPETFTQLKEVGADPHIVWDWLPDAIVEQNGEFVPKPIVDPMTFETFLKVYNMEVR